MNSYAYEAVDATGASVKGLIEVASQSQALQRIKQMGLFPLLVREKRPRRKPTSRRALSAVLPIVQRNMEASRLSFGRVKPRVLSVFTRQLATLLQAGMPLLRGLKILSEEQENRRLKVAVREVYAAIESGESLSAALAAQPKVFNGLYVNLVKAGEVSGALDTVLLRLAGFQEKALRIKGKVKAAMFYPAAVLFVAVGILSLLMIYVIPRFKEIFDGMLGGAHMPAFTLFVFNLSDFARHHAVMALVGLLAAICVFAGAVRTRIGRRLFDEFKLKAPLVGNVFRKAAIARLTRTLGTLLGSGVPILQALTIVRETAGNVVVSGVVGTVHERVKQGDPVAPTIRLSRVFPATVAGMIDVGEQTGALPEMLLKIADNYDDEVDNAVSAMTSLLEPVMIILLAVIVGSIVIALFLPILSVPDFL